MKLSVFIFLILLLPAGAQSGGVQWEGHIYPIYCSGNYENIEFTLSGGVTVSNETFAFDHVDSERSYNYYRVANGYLTLQVFEDGEDAKEIPINVGPDNKVYLKTQDGVEGPMILKFLNTIAFPSLDVDMAQINYDLAHVSQGFPTQVSDDGQRDPNGYLNSHYSMGVEHAIPFYCHNSPIE